MKRAHGMGRAAAAVCVAWIAVAAPARAQAPAPAADAAAPKGETVRAEVGKPLQAAQDLMKDKKFKDAVARIHEAEVVPNRTAYENFVIQRMLASAALQAGDVEAATTALEAVVAAAKLPPEEQARVIGALASEYFRQKNYAKSATWADRYLKDAGGDAKTREQMQELLIQSHYWSGDYVSASRELKEQVEADEKAGRTPTEERLQFLASCYAKLNDNSGYAATLERLVSYHPKKQYWADLISRVQRKPGFSERLELDLLRLQLASGNLSSSNDYMVLAQLAMQAGYPIEAKKVVEQGFAAGVLGKGAEAERHKRLQDLANKQANEDMKSMTPAGDAEAAAAATGDPLVNLGFDYVLSGKADKGLALMEQGLHKGGLKRPEDAKLHLGIAYALAGQKAKAAQVLATLHGNDGTADLGRLWSLYAGRVAG